MEGFNSMVPTQGNDGSNTSFIPFPPSHGNVSSGMPCNNASGSPVQGVAAIASEPKSENQQAPQGPREPESNVDPKRLRRILASRQYSQKYRLKQLQYILQLETEVKALQAELAINSPRITYSDRQNSLLREENNSMKQKLDAFSSELMLKEAEYEDLKKERALLMKFFGIYQPELQLPEMLEANHQLANMGFNQPEINDDFMEPGVPQMLNQNLNQFGVGGPSYNFM
nr:basic leucine zipper 34-like [Quercus suber]POF21033.1 basic leucine zipper 34 [Quercus suber]